MAEGTPISADRQHARATYPADLQTVGLHNEGNNEVVDVNWPNHFLAKPAGATHIKLQALTQNIRYRIDPGTVNAAPATQTDGFQLAAGTETLIPIPNTGISLAPEVAGAGIQYQWMR